MTRYVVLEPPLTEDGAALAEAAKTGIASERAVFVRDGFSIWALLFSVLWLLRYRLWVAAIITLALVVGLSFLDAIPGFGPAVPILELLVGLLVGLEGPSLRIEKLRRQGWTETAAFNADGRDEAEIIYYAGKASGEPESSVTTMPATQLPVGRQTLLSAAAGDRNTSDESAAEPLAPGVPPRFIAKPIHTDRFFDAAKAR